MSNPHFQKHTSSASSAANYQEMKRGARAFSAAAAASGNSGNSGNSGTSGASGASGAFGDSAQGLLNLPTPWSQCFDLQRQQLAWLTECASALFRGAESVRKTQQEAANRASVHYAATAQRLRTTEQSQDWLELLSVPLTIDIEGSEKYWAELAAASVQTQTELIHSIYQLFESDKAPESASTASMQKIWQTGIPPLAGSLFSNGLHGQPQQA